MTTQEILTRVMDIAQLASTSNATGTLQNTINALQKDLAAQVRTETAKSAGKGNAKRTIDAILRNVRKEGARTSLHYAWIDSENRQCFCDGFQAYRLKDHLPTEERPADAGDPIALEKIFPDASQYEQLPLPSYAELKAFVSVERARIGRKNDPVWYFGEGKPAVNAVYLLNALAIFQDATLSCTRDDRYRLHNPLYISSANGDGILCPVRYANGAQEDNTINVLRGLARQGETTGTMVTVDFDTFASISERVEPAAKDNAA